jgi:AbiV family abortive infection protein
MDRSHLPRLEQIYEAGVLARRNAKRFFYDAKALMGMKSYGHAYGMLVFAEEEAGKALIFHCFADGLLRNPEWLWLATAKHEAKHATMAVAVMMRLLFFFLFGLAPHESMRQKRRRWLKEGMTPTTVFHHIEQAAEDIPSAINVVANLIEELSDLGRLQARRENGFFVDLDDSGKPSGPHQFSKAECVRHVPLVRARLAMVNELLGSPKLTLNLRRASNKVDEKMREQIASFEAFLFAKNGKDRVLDWLSSNEPKDLVAQIRQFAADEDNVGKMRSAIKEVLSKRQAASIFESVTRSAFLSTASTCALPAL